MRKKILILGNSAKEYALAKKLSEKHEVFVAPGNDGIKEFAETIDIRDNSVNELLDFAKENNIDLTIPVSNSSITSGIIDLFVQNDLQIFGASDSAQKLIMDKFYTKKTLYKLRINTPKFGIFEKQNITQDFIKNCNGPFVIKTNEPSSAVICTSPNTSKPILDSVFAKQNPRVLIEDYVYGIPFAFYAITDGYKALPFGSSQQYKHSLEGEGGQLTDGMGSCAPSPNLSFENEVFLMENVIYPTLEYLENGGNPYLGIIGVNGIIKEDNSIQVLGYLPFMQDSDCAGILGTIDGSLYEYFISCIVGSFSDEVDIIEQNTQTSATVVLSCTNKNETENVITGLDDIEDEILISYYNNAHKNKYLEYEAENNKPILALTAFSSVISRAIKKVYDAVNNINFKGLHYRKDIGSSKITDDFYIY